MKKFIGGVALSLFALSAHAATVTPTISGSNDQFWSFGVLEGSDSAADSDYVSDTALDLAGGASTYFVDFFATPTDGSLTLTLTNSGSIEGTTATANLLGPDAGTGSYELYFDGDLLFTVDAGAAASQASISIASGTSADLVWVWDVQENGQVSTNLSPVPVPAAGFLLIGGLGGLAALRRKKKA